LGEHNSSETAGAALAGTGAARAGMAKTAALAAYTACIPCSFSIRTWWATPCCSRHSIERTEETAELQSSGTFALPFAAEVVEPAAAATAQIADARLATHSTKV